jgi:hypothetical protein
LTLQIVAVVVTPPHLRWITAGLLAMATIAAVLALAIEASFRRAAARTAEATTRAADLRGSSEPISPLLQRAYYLARNGSPASRIAGACDIPEAFAALIIDDVRRTASRRGRRGRRISDV